MSKILVIEDEADISELLKARLENAGYQVAQAFDGEQGLRLAQTFAPDLITLDLKLPILDGFNVCERLKKDPALKNIPIIMMSARTSGYEQQVGLSLGAVAYLAKPYDPAELLAAIGKQLGRG